MVKQITGAAADQLKGAGGENTGTGNFPDDGFGQEGGDGGRFDDGGHACQEVDRDLLEHSPDGEVECVDMDGDAFFGNQDMLGHEGVAFTQVGALPVEAEGGVRKFAAKRGIGEEVADPAFEVDPAVGAGGAGEVADTVEIL